MATPLRLPNKNPFSRRNSPNKIAHMPAYLAGVGESVAGGSPLLTQLVGLFNIFVGVMVVMALLMYGGGFIMWVTRLGSWPSPRDEAIDIMAWAPTILFVLVVLLAIVQALQRYPQAGAYIVSILVLLIIAWVIVYLVRHAGGGEDDEER